MVSRDDRQNTLVKLRRPQHSFIKRSILRQPYNPQQATSHFNHLPFSKTLPMNRTSRRQTPCTRNCERRRSSVTSKSGQPDSVARGGSSATEAALLEDLDIVFNDINEPLDPTTAGPSQVPIVNNCTNSNVTIVYKTKNLAVGTNHRAQHP